MKTLSLSISLIILAIVADAQHINFANYKLLLPYYSPAATGMGADQTSFTLGVRLSDRYKTQMFVYEQKFKGEKANIGFILQNDLAGDGKLGFTEVGINYSYHFQLSRKFKIGLGAQSRFRTVGYFAPENLKTQEQLFNGSIAYTPYDRYNYADFPVSAIAYFNNGWKSSHLLKEAQIFTGAEHIFDWSPQISNLLYRSSRAGVDLPLMFHAGGSLVFSKKAKAPVYKIFALYFRQLNSTKGYSDNTSAWQQLNLSGNCYLENFKMGAGINGFIFSNKNYQSVERVMLNLGCNFDRMNITYTVDIPLSNTMINTNLITHEWGLKFHFNSHEKRGLVPCPVF